MSKQNIFKKAMQTGGVLANAVQIVSYFLPSLTTAAIGALVVTIWSGALAWIQKPSVYVPALVFGYLFVIISSLKSRRMKLSPEYEYAISSEGGMTALPALSEKNTHGVILIFPFRNVCTAPIKLIVEEYRIVLDEKTYADQAPTPEIVVPRLSQKGIKSAFVSRDTSKTNLSGSTYLEILYGALNAEASRKYIFRSKIEVIINEQGQTAVMQEIMEETDTPYVPG